jgi:hypothetical protein
VLVVHRLAGVLLEVQPLDSDLDVLELALAVGTDRDDDLALTDDRILVLGDLIALWQVRIEIVLAVEHRAVVDLCLEAKTGAHGLGHAFLVDHRQHAGHRRINKADIGVGGLAEFGRGP